MMRTANPALNSKTFKVSTLDENRMTLSGTVNKSLILICLVFFSAYYTWHSFFHPESSGLASAVQAFYLPAIFINLIVAFVIVFKKHLAPTLAPVYALTEGVLLGFISAAFEARMPGIAIQAIGGTMGVFMALLLAYRSGLIKATENFKLGVAAATGGIFLLYMVNLVMGFFGMSVPFLHESGPMGIGISVVIVAVAALNLVLDFDFIEQGAERGAPKYMEWYASFGLLVTLCWLYIEILRLLAKLNDR